MLDKNTKFLQVHIDGEVHKIVKYISVLTRQRMSAVVESAVRHYARMLQADKTFTDQLMEVQYPGSTKAPETVRRKSPPGGTINPL